MKKNSKIMVYVRQIQREGHELNEIVVNDGDGSLGENGAVLRSEAEAMHREWNTPFSENWIPVERWMADNGIGAESASV